MHWADVLAEELLKEDKKHVLATGITPSGPIHIGNMREILTTDAVYRSLLSKGGDAELIYVADDYDHLRKVYPYLPNTYEKYVGIPISEIPCPCGKHNSYADHYLISFLNALKEIGVQPKIYRAREMYKKKDYNEAIQIALENTDKIKEIIQNISKRQLPKDWIPFNIQCEKCRRLTTTKATMYDHPKIEYQCECGHEGEVDVRVGGNGKLPWRVDWPARWKMLGVTFEPFGKDLGTTGGARDTGEKIVEDIYGYPAPKYTVYEFILLKGMGAMHSSKGTALSAEEMLKMTPPEVLRFLIMNNQPNKHIVFDTGLGLLNLVDEYDKLERVYFEKEEAIKGMKDLKKTYELSQPHDIPKSIPFQLPYRHLVTLTQIAKEWEDVKKILLRTNQIPKDISTKDEEHLKQRVENVRYWLENFAPDMVKFEVKKTLPKISLKEKEKKFLENLLGVLSKTDWGAENIHNAFYQIAEKEKIPIQDAFKSIYQIILGQEKGPRAGYFLSNLDKDFLLKQIKEAIK
jgi:lysyl-tRNA synthetase, class I